MGNHAGNQIYKILLHTTLATVQVPPVMKIHMIDKSCMHFKTKQKQWAPTTPCHIF